MYQGAGYCLCGPEVPELPANAHIHGSDETFRLCWTCGRAYDIGIVRTEEVIEAAQRWQAGDITRDLAALHRTWEIGLRAGRRAWKTRMSHEAT